MSFRKARLEEALAGYSQRYLSALFEVEAALLEERKSDERLVLVEQQLVTSQRLLAEARNRFRGPHGLFACDYFSLDCAKPGTWCG